MFSYCRAEDAVDEHRRLLAWQEEMLAAVELPYRVIDIAAGDLGSSAARKFDCEAWLPSQQRWMEVTSASNCTTFQARRLGIRERTEHGTRPVATLNGTRHHAVDRGAAGEPSAGRRFGPCARRAAAVPRWPRPVRADRVRSSGMEAWLVALDVDGTLAVCFFLTAASGRHQGRAAGTGRRRSRRSCDWAVVALDGAGHRSARCTPLRRVLERCGGRRCGDRTLCTSSPSMPVTPFSTSPSRFPTPCWRSRSSASDSA